MILSKHSFHLVQSKYIALYYNLWLFVHSIQKVGFVKPSDAAIDAEGRNTDIYGKVLQLHSDNGAPMRCSTMVAKCLELGIACTYNRPRHSNDNAHMETSFRLLKHGHEVAIPQSFDTLSQAKEWVNQYY